MVGLLLIPVCLIEPYSLPVLPTIGEALLIFASRLLEWTWPFLQWMADLPAAQWTHAEPPFWTIPLALLGFVLLLSPKGIPARWLGSSWPYRQSPFSRTGRHSPVFTLRCSMLARG